MRVSVSQLRRIIRESVKRELYENAEPVAALRADLSDPGSEISQEVASVLDGMSVEELEEFVRAAQMPSEKSALAAAVEKEVRLGEARRYGRGRRLREGDSSWSSAHEMTTGGEGGGTIAGIGASIGLSLVPAVANWVASNPSPDVVQGRGALAVLAGFVLGHAANYAVRLIRNKRKLQAKYG